jgi:Serine/threonine protein kinase
MNKIAFFQKRQMGGTYYFPVRGLVQKSSNMGMCHYNTNTSSSTSSIVGKHYCQWRRGRKGGERGGNATSHRFFSSLCDNGLGRRGSVLLNSNPSRHYYCYYYLSRLSRIHSLLPAASAAASLPVLIEKTQALLMMINNGKRLYQTQDSHFSSFFYSNRAANLPLAFCGLACSLLAAFEFVDQQEFGGGGGPRDNQATIPESKWQMGYCQQQQQQQQHFASSSKRKCSCEPNLYIKVDPTLPLNTSRIQEDHTLDHENPTASTSTTTKKDSNSQPRNVMLHRHRSTSSRSLSAKYNVDWKTVLGEGAYGSVHPARLASTGEKVALKKIAKRYTDTSSFCRETNALLRIYNNGGHPNISGLRDMYEDVDHYYLVMDLVSGGEMFDHLIHYGAYSEADAARLMREVASALAFLHGVGVVHADLKPENLLLCSKKRVDGTIKMIDFGCAIVEKEQEEESREEEEDKYGNGSVDVTSLKSSNGRDTHQTIQSWLEILNRKRQQTDHSSSSLEQSTEFTGTTAYWPPERFITSSPPDHAADMWAVGVILYIMLTGVHPFDLTGVATDAEIAEQIKKDPSPPISKGLTSHLSPSAIELIQLLMEKNPKRRLTADQMLQHPWIAGDEATTEVMQHSAEKLEKFRNLRHILEAGIFSILIEKGSKDMVMSEYTPKMVYKDDQKGGVGKQQAPASSVLKKAFEAFDEGGKGFISADDLSRVVTETTGQKLSDMEKNEMIVPFNEDAAGSLGLSLSSFSKIAAGLKHKHYPRGHIVFRAGDVGDAMYFINSGKVEIQTKKGQLIHILRHGDFFGEGSLLEAGDRRFSTAKCATPVDLIKIKRSDFER